MPPAKCQSCRLRPADGSPCPLDNGDAWCRVAATAHVAFGSSGESGRRGGQGTGSPARFFEGGRWTPAIAKWSDVSRPGIFAAEADVLRAAQATGVTPRLLLHPVSLPTSDPKHPFRELFVMGRADGAPWGDGRGPIPFPDDFRRPLLALLRNVAALHRAGYSHLDLKPQNLFYDPQTGRVTLIDLGTAQRRGGESRFCGGTAPYAPVEEQSVGACGTSDDFACGVLFVQAVLGLSTDDLKARLEGGAALHPKTGRTVAYHRFPDAARRDFHRRLLDNGIPPAVAGLVADRLLADAVDPATLQPLSPDPRGGALETLVASLERLGWDRVRAKTRPATSSRPSLFPRIAAVFAAAAAAAAAVLYWPKKGDTGGIGGGGGNGGTNNLVQAQLHTATFKDWGGVHPLVNLAKGAPLNPPTARERQGYTFSGWSPSIPRTMPATNVAFTAQYVPKEYTITWRSMDKTGTSQITKWEKIPYGETPKSYAMPDYTKDGSQYTFAGWSPAIGKVASNTTYVAIYKRKASPPPEEPTPPDPEPPPPEPVQPVIYTVRHGNGDVGQYLLHVSLEDPILIEYAQADAPIRHEGSDIDTNGGTKHVNPSQKCPVPIPQGCGGLVRYFVEKSDRVLLNDVEATVHSVDDFFVTVDVPDWKSNQYLVVTNVSLAKEDKVKSILDLAKKENEEKFWEDLRTLAAAGENSEAHAYARNYYDANNLGRKTLNLPSGYGDYTISYKEFTIPFGEDGDIPYVVSPRAPESGHSEECYTRGTNTVHVAWDAPGRIKLENVPLPLRKDPPYAKLDSLAAGTKYAIFTDGGSRWLETTVPSDGRIPLTPHKKNRISYWVREDNGRVDTYTYTYAEPSCGAGQVENPQPEVERGTVPTYAISQTIKPSAGGSITDCPQEAEKNASITFGVAPKPGYQATGIPILHSSNQQIACKNVQGAQDKYQFTMPASPVTISVEFKPISYTIDITQSVGGAVTCDPAPAMAGTKITVTLTPHEGYKVKSAACNGNSISLKEEKGKYTGSFTMPATNVTVSAEFEKASQEVDVRALLENLEEKITKAKTMHNKNKLKSTKVVLSDPQKQQIETLKTRYGTKKNLDTLQRAYKDVYGEEMPKEWVEFIP